MAQAKEAAARATRRAADYSWWAHHGMQLLVGAVACLLKFSQDEGLRRLLLSTQGALLVETAPNDGSWGVAMNSSVALRQSELARHFGLRSVAEETLQFEVRGAVHTRPRREANALGKALMVARSMLLADIDAPAGIELRDAVGLVTQHLRLLALPISWNSAEHHLSAAL